MTRGKLSIRINESNPDHHLWNNNGTWWIDYVIHPTPITKQRIRHSLNTKSVEEARRKRDEIFRQHSSDEDEQKVESFLALPVAA